MKDLTIAARSAAPVLPDHISSAFFLATSRAEDAAGFVDELLRQLRRQASRNPDDHALRDVVRELAARFD